MKNDKSKEKASDSISLNPLSFEEALEGLLNVKPVENKTLAKPKKQAKQKPPRKVT